ncbi:HlyD family efflux transporter periplasmic adaptor subunit [Neobacillus niacini]|uniref:HlyD family efflux transporter periplasmic adaptor subunit n=1 Tax=Neobacillus niacini TaxID=86668 RepID=UPI0039833401
MKLYNKEELKESRIFFDQHPPKYLFFLNWFLVMLLVVSLFGANFITKNYIVKAQGTIEADDKRYVTPVANGNIAEIHKQEGAQVRKGDKLLTLSVGIEGVQEDEIQKQINDLEAKKEVYEKYEKSLIEKTNYLKNNGDEQAYYGKVAYYLEQLHGEETESEHTSETINQKRSELVKLKEELEIIQHENQEKYQKDLARKQSQLKKLQKELQELQDKETNDGILVTEKEVKESEIDSLLIEIENMKETSDEQLQSELDAKKSELKGLEQEIKDLERQGESAPVSNSTYNQLISELGTERIQTNDKITELESQRNVNSANSNTLTITANKDGYLHYLVPIKTGVGLQSFQPVAQIANDKEAELIVESYIPAQDVSKMNVNDPVKVAIAGVNQTKFGMLKGNVKEISNGTIIQQGENNSKVMLYQVTVALKTKELQSDKEIIKARASMPVVANIVYDHESYLEWLLEQLNFTK